jgi:hypothetical protein
MPAGVVDAGGTADGEHVHRDHIAGFRADHHEWSAQQDVLTGLAPGALHPDGAAGDDLRHARDIGMPVVVAEDVPGSGVCEVEQGG